MEAALDKELSVNRAGAGPCPEFSSSGRVTAKEINRKILDFLENFGEPHLVGEDFYRVIGDGDGDARFARMIAASGYGGDPPGFLAEIMDRLCNLSGGRYAPMSVKGVEIPLMMAVWLLESVIPGRGFMTVKDAGQFEKLTNSVIPEQEFEAVQKVINAYPVRLSMHCLRQMLVSEAVWRQYSPFAGELDTDGDLHTWVGRYHKGLVERMYRNRIILLINMNCPVYCRFCFRKHKDLRNQPNPATDDIIQAVEYVRENPAITEILVTGGDPFLTGENLAAAIDGLKDIPHVRVLRLATRSVSYYPDLFQGRSGYWLDYLRKKSVELGAAGKRIELATHFIHPDELSVQSLEIISGLVSRGITVYVQTPLLNECNDRGPELVRLFRLLRGAGAELHYIFMPCSPIKGNGAYKAPVSRGLEIACHLRAHLSDRAVPGICTATSIGKIDWFTSGWAVEADAMDENYIWIRTPYTPAFFTSFGGSAGDLGNVRINSENTLDVRFMAEIGNESFFLEKKPACPSPGAAIDRRSELPRFRREALRNQQTGLSVVPFTPSRLYRQHVTRVEIDTGAGDEEINYIQYDNRITDVLISGKADTIDNLNETASLIGRLKSIRHVNAVRLRSFKFNYCPEIYTGEVISRLGGLNGLSVSRPLRLEIETMFLGPGEITRAHGNIAARLRGLGITVYGNLPLLKGVNDTEQQVRETARKLRAIGVEFHHVYVAGLPIQRVWGAGNPMEVSEVVRIASGLRMEGSGREIPGYIIFTDLGEVDFGSTSRLIRKDEGLAALLLPYDLNYYLSMCPGFNWPGHVEADFKGRPIVPVPGLTASNDFLIYPPPSGAGNPFEPEN